MAAWPHVLENQLPDSLSSPLRRVFVCKGGCWHESGCKVSIFTHEILPLFFQFCLASCASPPLPFFLISISYFFFSWMCARGFDSGPDHMTALASNTGVCGRIGRGPRYSIWPPHWWNSIYLRLENVMAVNRTPLKILFVLYLGQIKWPNCKSESLSYQFIFNPENTQMDRCLLYEVRCVDVVLSFSDFYRFFLKKLFYV